MHLAFRAVGKLFPLNGNFRKHFNLDMSYRVKRENHLSVL